MNAETFLPVLKGLFSKFTGYKKKVPSPTGGTINSRYCYSVWMRHLVHASRSGYSNTNATVAELGPGDSLGTGLAALLCGCSRYYALDIFKYWDVERNLKIFDELIELLKQRAAIPGDDEFPRTTPKLDSYSFPTDILSAEILQRSLSEERINKIRNELMHSEESKANTFIHSYVPWDDTSIIEKDSVDFFFSQAVLQSVNDLDETYAAMRSWLRSGGIMSHSIDLSSVGLTKSWNGHWTFSDTEWRIVSQKTVIPLNRATLGDHLSLLEKHNFQLTEKIGYPAPVGFNKTLLAKQFREMTEESFSTRAAFLQAIKKYPPGY